MILLIFLQDIFTILIHAYAILDVIGFRATQYNYEELISNQSPVTLAYCDMWTAPNTRWFETNKFFTKYVNEIERNPYIYVSCWRKYRTTKRATLSLISLAGNLLSVKNHFYQLHSPYLTTQNLFCAISKNNSGQWESCVNVG